MSKEEVRHQKASDPALWMSVDSLNSCRGRNRYLCLLHRCLGTSWIQNHNFPLETQRETWFLVDCCFEERKDLGVVIYQNVSLKGRLKPRNSICQLPASCSPGSTMSLLIIFCPLTLCSNLTSPASQACLCAWSVDKSGWRRLSVVLSSLTWEVTDLSFELWLLWLQCLP